MKRTSRNFSITRAGLIGMPLMAATLLASQAGWAEEKSPAEKKSLIFFRGGYTEYAEEGRGFESFTEIHNTIGLGDPNTGEEGWYVGAAIEHSITSNLWGLMPGTEVLGEIGLEFKNFGTQRASLAVSTVECSELINFINAVQGDPGLGLGADEVLAGQDSGCVVVGDNTITMFTVSASPKIKFLEGSIVRPWIIPAGLDFHVISPPSDAATVLDVGVQFAGGVEIEVLPGIKAGVDGRYHYAANKTNTQNNIVEVINRELAEEGIPPDVLSISGITDKDNDFWTVGAYLGFSF
jgi:hypothetical protein